MAINKQVIRWPYQISSGSNQFRCTDGFTDSDRTFSTVTTWIAKGETTTTSPPTDIVDQFETELTAAIQAIHLAGSVTVTLGSDQRLELSRTGGGDFDIEWTDGVNTTLDAALLGFDVATDFTITTTPTKAPYQVYGAWYANVDADHDSGERDVNVVAETDDVLNGRISRIVHNSAPFQERLMRFDIVPSARLLKYRITQSDFATFAGVVLNDPNTPLEVLVDYLLGRTDIGGITFPEGGTIYLYSTDDPTTHTQEGGYQVRLKQLTQDLQAVGSYFAPESVQTNMSSEHHPVRFVLRKEA